MQANGATNKFWVCFTTTEKEHLGEEFDELENHETQFQKKEFLHKVDERHDTPL